MRITLHDNIHSSAGSAHPALRPSLGNAARAPWARAMHQFLERLPREGGTFVADADADVATIRVRAGRHGDAVWAVWSVAPADEVVAASVLLRGAAPPDDDAAIQSMRDAAPALPFGPADFSALAAEPRPCLGTMYLDARWYDNARVELAATALALAAIHGPDGRLSVEGEPTPPPAATPRAVEPRAGPWSEKRQDGLKFNFTRERLQRRSAKRVGEPATVPLERTAGRAPHRVDRDRAPLELRELRVESPGEQRARALARRPVEPRHVR